MNETFGMANAAAALGIGMLVGLERERHKGRGDSRACAGLRTFAITALLGYVSMQVSGSLLLGIVAICVALLLTVAWHCARAGHCHWCGGGGTADLPAEIALLCTQPVDRSGNARWTGNADHCVGAAAPDTRSLHRAVCRNQFT